MINVTVIAVGRLKENYLREGCGEYIKRLGAYAKVSVIEINEERCSDNPSTGEIQSVIKKEGERIIGNQTVIDIKFQTHTYNTGENNSK